LFSNTIQSNISPLNHRGDLKETLKEEESFTEERAKMYAAEVVLALEELHKHNTLYRDLKPENILIDEEGHVALTDFGLSKEGVDDKMITTSFCGTPAYLAPEIITQSGYKKTVDWYSLGVLVYEMLTGKVPYTGKDM